MNIEKDVECVLLNETELDEITTRLAAEITRDYESSPQAVDPFYFVGVAYLHLRPDS